MMRARRWRMRSGRLALHAVPGVLDSGSLLYTEDILCVLVGGGVGGLGDEGLSVVVLVEGFHIDEQAHHCLCHACA